MWNCWVRRCLILSCLNTRRSRSASSTSSRALKRYPHFIEIAQRQLAGVPPIWIQVAKEENDGNIDLIDKTLRAGSSRRSKTSVRPGRGTGARFSARVQPFPRNRSAEAVRKAIPDWRLGADHYAHEIQAEPRDRPHSGRGFERCPNASERGTRANARIRVAARTQRHFPAMATTAI